VATSEARRPTAQAALPPLIYPRPRLAALASLEPPYAAAGSPATRFPRRAAWRASLRHGGGPAAAASRCGGLSPRAWGKRRPRRRERLLRAPLARFAERAGRIAGCSFRWGLPA
jgi:hypothetical protein